MLLGPNYSNVYSTELLSNVSHKQVSQHTYWNTIVLVNIAKISAAAARFTDGTCCY